MMVVVSHHHHTRATAAAQHIEFAIPGPASLGFVDAISMRVHMWF